jgi:hypothetical protein
MLARVIDEQPGQCHVDAAVLELPREQAESERNGDEVQRDVSARIDAGARGRAQDRVAAWIRVARGSWGRHYGVPRCKIVSGT